MTTKQENPNESSRTSRLERVHEDRSIAPFVRAGNVPGAAAYWMPVSDFPVPLLQRRWLLQFLDRLSAHQQQEGLREEWFVLQKAVYPDLLDLFIDRSSDYAPFPGMTLIPGTDPIGQPDFEDVKSVIDKGSKEGTPIDVTRWMPDIAHWFLLKEGKQQRQDFLGHGGMFGFYAAPPAKAAPFPKLPKLITSHPSYNPQSEKQYHAAVSLQDDFLKRSKQLFGKPFENDPAARGYAFILPLLTAQSIVDAEAKDREKWFEIADLYFFESAVDKGMLLLSSDPDFDDTLWPLLDAMRHEGEVYPQ